jgi:DNA-binding PadR family transcriptional regulator
MPINIKTVTDSELAIMSLLVEKPMHGYQIEQTIVDRGMREWTTIGFSSIYYILEKLKKLGWLAGSIEIGDGKGPARQIFSLTTKGKENWEKAILIALAHPSRNNSNFQLGLSNLVFLEKQQIISALENYLKELAQKYLELSVKKERQKVYLPWNVLAMFDLSLTQIKSQLDWLKNFIDSIRNRNSI